MIKKIPSQVIEVLEKIQKAGFEAYIVGGCVRDLIMDKEPNDWDVTTSAKPEEVLEIFGEENSFYENDFGTVGIKIRNQESGIENQEEKKEIVEVTTYRIESKYSDKRRPDEVKFAKTLEEDLSRRDFTVNSIALKIKKTDAKLQIKGESMDGIDHEIVDLFDGRKDIKNRIVRAVGDANERFDEDALRMMRAVRFHSQLGFDIEEKTLEAIKKNVSHIEYISTERVKDEFSKIILSSNPAEGVDMLHETGLLNFVIPELENGVDVGQNRHHIHTIYKHNLLALKFCPSKKLEVRLAALLHDIAKPQTKRGEGYYSTFYNHDHVGARVAKKILQRLKFSNEIINKVVLLVDNHMFYYNPEEVGEASVRRLIQKVGLENMKDLMDVRIADRLGSGTPKAKPYKLRHLEYLIDKVSKDAVSVKMLKIGGNDLIKELKLAPGPKIGAILDVLLAEVIEDAKKNNRQYLLKKATELDKEDLSKLREMAKEKIEEKKEEDDKELKGKYWVK
ncbi:MAG: HD domain-containing protein [Candidatus Moranbacteria bacterium]|jgi:poly(A) polymerase/tRNA nucleotidyltransferase (CCA-adding enzyme)|nr:HD domain-containing protein [Candidatus Moranbacteria bacterium]